MPSKKPLYGIWINMLHRCYNKNRSGYDKYGARGIRVCKRWRESYDAFAKDMGKRPSPIHTVDRKKNSKNYTPSNCKWSTPAEQARNRRTNVRGTYKGKTKVLMDWAPLAKVSQRQFYNRVRYYGWSVKKALETPHQKSFWPKLIGKTLKKFKFTPRPIELWVRMRKDEDLPANRKLSALTMVTSYYATHKLKFVRSRRGDMRSRFS